MGFDKAMALQACQVYDDLDVAVSWLLLQQQLKIAKNHLDDFDGKCRA